MKNTGTLKVTLPDDTSVLLERTFDAPRHLVWKAMTEPELVKKWYGPRGYSLTVCEIDLRVGGRWRYMLRGPGGPPDMGMSGEYRELSAPDRLVSTESMDDYPGEALVTVTLVETDGKTRLQSHVRSPSKEVRDAVVASGMEHGAAETYDRLNELLPSLM